MSAPIWSLRGRRRGETLWNSCNWCPWFASSCDSWQRGRNMSQECVFAGSDLREPFEDSGLTPSWFQSPGGQKQSGWKYLRQEVKSIIQMLVKYHSPIQIYSQDTGVPLFYLRHPELYDVVVQIQKLDSGYEVVVDWYKLFNKCWVAGGWHSAYIYRAW